MYHNSPQSVERRIWECCLIRTELTQLWAEVGRHKKCDAMYLVSESPSASLHTRIFITLLLFQEQLEVSTGLLGVDLLLSRQAGRSMGPLLALRLVCAAKTPSIACCMFNASLTVAGGARLTLFACTLNWNIELDECSKGVFQYNAFALSAFVNLIKQNTQRSQNYCTYYHFLTKRLTFQRHDYLIFWFALLILSTSWLGHTGASCVDCLCRSTFLRTCGFSSDVWNRSLVQWKENLNIEVS